MITSLVSLSLKTHFLTGILEETDSEPESSSKIVNTSTFIMPTLHSSLQKTKTMGLLKQYWFEEFPEEIKNIVFSIYNDECKIRLLKRDDDIINKLGIFMFTNPFNREVETQDYRVSIGKWNKIKNVSLT